LLIITRTPRGRLRLPQSALWSQPGDEITIEIAGWAQSTTLNPRRCVPLELRAGCALLSALVPRGAALRPISGIGPRDPFDPSRLHTSHAVSGLLATIPVLCMGLFAPPAASSRSGSALARASAFALVG